MAKQQAYERRGMQGYIRPRSLATRALASPLYKQRVVRPKKGRGSYKRKSRSQGRER